MTMSTRRHLLALLAASALAGPACGGKAATGPAPEKMTAAPQDEAAPQAEAPREAEAPAGPKHTLVIGKKADGSLKSQLAAAQKAAKERGQRLFVELHADWCEPCQALAKSLGDPRMAKAFDGTYIVRFSVEEAWGSELSDAGYDGSAIPVFYEVGPDLASTGYTIGGDAWGDNIPANMAPPLDRYFHGKAAADEDDE
ncbi:MAG: thioredoxin family protein [Deltaproteobacteria bacterium]|nr:thioredoxin family protein [Deltaproteobacteria bacterium]